MKVNTFINCCLRTSLISWSSLIASNWLTLKISILGPLDDCSSRVLASNSAWACCHSCCHCGEIIGAIVCGVSCVVSVDVIIDVGDVGVSGVIGKAGNDGNVIGSKLEEGGNIVVIGVMLGMAGGVGSAPDYSNDNEQRENYKNK